MQQMITAILWFAALSVGLMAGIYFAFSFFVLQALDAAGRPAGMAAMQSINRVIVRSPFLPLFFTSSLSCLLLAVLGVMHWDSVGAWQMAGGGLLYLAGMLVVTAFANVPLNNRLDVVDADGPEGEAMWRRYLRRWLPWNHVRTVSCMASMVLFIAAIAVR